MKFYTECILQRLVANDANGALVNAINSVKDQTGVEASVNTEGKLVLTSREGRAINMTGGSKAGEKGDIGKALGISEKIAEQLTGTMFVGRLNLVRLDGRDIKVQTGSDKFGQFSVAFSATAAGDGGNQQSVALRVKILNMWGSKILSVLSLKMWS